MSTFETMAEICRPRKESSMQMIHGMIHDACYELQEGNLEKAKEILAEADQLTHRAIEEENN